MPELPEVETTRLALLPAAKHKRIQSAVIRNPRLRWPVDLELNSKISGKEIIDIKRRAKYLIFELSQGALIAHLGMSGHFKIVSSLVPWEKHDHFGLEVEKFSLRLHDPRRFGSILHTDDDWQDFKLFQHLGPEPLGPEFNATALQKKLTSRTLPIKCALMDNKVVVGVGNIYACEALFKAKISPMRPACTITKQETQKIVKSIKKILTQAIECGGTTLKDFQHGDGKLGFFQQRLKVYGQHGERCGHCTTIIEKITLGQRSTFFCSKCQT